MRYGFLFDLDLPKWWRRAVPARDPTVPVSRVGIPYAPPLGSTDPELLEWCELNNYYLVTDKRHSMPGHLASGGHVPGIFRAAMNFPIDLLVEHLQLIGGASIADEYCDCITYLPIFPGSP